MRSRRTSDRGGRYPGATCEVREFWLPTGAGVTAATWFLPAEDTRSGVGVLIVGGIIHEQQTMALGIVALARQLAEHGVPTMTIDLTGTAQSAGTLDEPDLGARWDDDVRSAVGHLRDSGVRHVIVVGVRLGALVAAHATVDDPVDRMVMWAPVLSGRRHLRELQIMAAAAVEQDQAAPGLTVAGFTVPPSVLDHLRSLDVDRLGGKPAAAVTFADTAERLADLDPRGWCEALPVDRLETPETERWLFTDADLFPVPFGDVARVRRHIVAQAALLDPASATPANVLTQAPDEPRAAVMLHEGVLIRETFVEFGPRRLRGILSEPVGDTATSGVDDAGPSGVGEPVSYVAVTTVGPGRIFVDLARREAARGRVTLRFELAGFGTSPAPSRQAWAEFYHPSASDDIGAAVDLLAGRGRGRIHVVAFCAGAWSALRMAPRSDVDRIVAVNPQLLIRTRLLHRRPAPGQSRLHRGLVALGARPQVRRFMKRAEREFPVPSPALRRVGRHVAAGTAVSLAFAEGDPGHDYVLARGHRPGGLGRRGRRPDIAVYPGLGHLPSGPARAQLLEDLHRSA